MTDSMKPTENFVFTGLEALHEINMVYALDSVSSVNDTASLFTDSFVHQKPIKVSNKLF